MGFNVKELSRRRAIALAAGLTTTVLPIWGTALAVAPYPGEPENEKRKGEAQPSATEDLMAQHGLLSRILNVYAERISGLAAASLLQDRLAGRGGRIDWGELALMEEGGERGVGLSFFARWSAEP